MSDPHLPDGWTTDRIAEAEAFQRAHPEYRQRARKRTDTAYPGRVYCPACGVLHELGSTCACANTIEFDGIGREPDHA